MSKTEIIKLIQSFNSPLDIQFLESLSKVQLEGYAEHLKALSLKRGRTGERVPSQTAAR